MSKTLTRLVAGLSILALTMSFSITTATAQDKPSRKIVVFETNYINEAAQNELIAKAGGVVVKDLDLINSKAVYLPSKAAEQALLNQTGVKRIDDDVVILALDKSEGISINGKPASSQPAETLPWGIDRIEADSAWSTTTGSAIKVAVVDTGIDLSHPDLKANIKGGYNAINPNKSYTDDNGHGTHVAGIIGAINNEIGVIGAAPTVGLYSVKVLDRRGSGYLSDVIEGLDWSIQANIDVINMSLGTNSNILSFHEAIQKVREAGIIQVAAAGNDGGAVDYPAAYPETIAVSAIDSSNTIANWSSRGPEVDLAAPGVNIYSTYKGSTYKTLSGTSMATPHVAGTAALVLTRAVDIYDLDADGIWDPVEVQNKLEVTATDLGVAGKDNLYGAGLVNAYQAVLP